MMELQIRHMSEPILNSHNKLEYEPAQQGGHK